LKHYTSPAFWRHFDALPEQTQQLARRSYERLKTNPRHPSLHLKKVEGRHYKGFSALPEPKIKHLQRGIG